MKAAELRIGNLIFDGEGEYLVVDEIKEDGFKAQHLEVFNLRFHPEDEYGIELTDEWLMKLGFEKNQEFISFRIALEPLSKIKSRAFIVVCLDGDAWIEIISQEGLESSPTYRYAQTHVINLQFVHQLQNLYFAITGNELTVNPTH